MKGTFPLSNGSLVDSIWRKKMDRNCTAGVLQVIDYIVNIIGSRPGHVEMLAIPLVSCVVGHVQNAAYW
jgi:hypothetical protein